MSKRPIGWLVVLLAGALAPSAARAALIGFYEFNNNVNDTSAFGSALDMTATGGSGAGPGTAPTYISDTPTTVGGWHFPGQSLSLNGSPSFAYVSPGANTKYELNSFTIETWIKPSTSNATGTIYSYAPRGSGGDGRGILFGLANGKVQMQYSNSTNNSFYVIGGNATFLAANTWYHIAISFDWPLFGSNTSFAGYKIFVNGVVDGGSGFGFGTPPFTLGIDYTDRPGPYGPTPETAYIGGFHNGNDTAPDLAVDMLFPLPSGTLIDRLRIHNTVFGNYVDGSQGIGLDWYVVPEPASLGLLAIGVALGVSRRPLRGSVVKHVATPRRDGKL